VLASRLGAAAVEALLQGHTNVMVGIVANSIKLTPMRQTWGRKKNIDYELIKLAEVLS
jgi:6-phosphofructokinase 1